MKKLIGAHTSASGGVANAVINAVNIDASAFALFVKNQRQWNAKPLEESTIIEFKQAMKENNFQAHQVLPHAGYLINLANADSEKREKSIESFIDEMKRVQALGLDRLNVHPGSHLQEISEAEALDLVVECIDQACEAVQDILVVIENTAGQGSNLGYSFEHLSHIIQGVKDTSRIGVCFDTCHAFAAGYDISTEEGYIQTFNEFERIVGFRYLKGIHLNDAMVKLGSKKDRHESIGKGNIGMEFFKRFMKDDRFNGIPIILETIDETIWTQEIQLLRSFE